MKIVLLRIIKIKRIVGTRKKIRKGKRIEAFHTFQREDVRLLCRGRGRKGGRRGREEEKEVGGRRQVKDEEEEERGNEGREK